MWQMLSHLSVSSSTQTKSFWRETVWMYCL